MKLPTSRHKVLYLIIFCTLIIIPILVMAAEKKPFYTLEKNISQGPSFAPVLSNGSYASVGVCFKNTSSNDYFLPNKTKPEWMSFTNAVASSKISGVSKTICCGDGVCGEGENQSNCSLDCGAEEDGCRFFSSDDNSRPEIFTAALYYANQNVVTNTGTNYPGCGITSSMLNGSSPFYYNEKNFSTDGYTKYNVSTCASLVRANGKICSGDTCIKAVVPSSYSVDGQNMNKIWQPDFCYGEYDHVSELCGYVGLDYGLSMAPGNAVAIGKNTVNNLDFTYSSQNPNLFTKEVETKGDWGACSNCGDGWCDASSGENVTSCFIDCGGTPPASCGNGACDGSEDCSNCVADCGTCGTDPIYVGAAYFASQSSSGSCGLPSGVNAAGYQGNNYYSCVSLLKSNSTLSNGATCVAGVEKLNSNSPKYCIGKYDSRKHKCVYDQAAYKDYISPETLTFYLNSGGEPVWGNSMPSGYQTIGSWGSCQ